MSQSSSSSMFDAQVWKRILYMLVLGFAYSIAEIVLIAVIVGQIVLKLITGNDNEPLKKLGKQLSKYVYSVFMFLTFNSEEKPFPFQGWDEQGKTAGTQHQ